MKGAPFAFPEVRHDRYWPVLLKSTEAATEVRLKPARWVVVTKTARRRRSEIT